MKRCPECRRDYTDETLNFCLDDGAALLDGPGSSEAATAIFTTDADPKRSSSVSSKKYFVFAIVAAVVAIGAFWFVSIRSRNISTASASPPNDNFLRAKVLVANENADDVDTAIQLLEKVVADDPKFAPGWAQLARAYNLKAFFFAQGEERKKLNQNAEIAAERSLTIDPNLADGYLARGMVLWTHAKRFPHDAAIQTFKRAISIDPNLDEAHHRLGLVYFHIGLFDKARAEIAKAVEINSGNTLARYRFGVIDLYSGRYEDAAEFFKSTASEQNPALTAFQYATAILHLGRTDEAESIIDGYLSKNPKDQGGVATSVKAMILAKKGRAAEAIATIKKAEEIGAEFGHFHHTAYNIAVAYAMLKKPDLAVKYLQMAADDGFPCYPLFERDEFFKEMRHFPGFVSLLAKLKLQWERYNSTL
jgi:tetratricopeptide (TPR) repeat protein